MARCRNHWLLCLLLGLICGCASSQPRGRVALDTPSNGMIESVEVSELEEQDAGDVKLASYRNRAQTDAATNDTPVQEEDNGGLVEAEVEAEPENATLTEPREGNATLNEPREDAEGVEALPSPNPEPDSREPGNDAPGFSPGATEDRLRTPNEDPILIFDVAASIRSAFPLLDAALQENEIARGNWIAAWGAFDTKLKAASENGPLGFYETYRNSAGFTTPIYQGGEVFGGYRIGRGSFQPWYLERETNGGGEFKAGVLVPLLRNRDIDARRADLWRAVYDRQRVEPEVRAQLIGFVLEGSVAYWEWIAAGRRFEIGRIALEFAEERNDQLERMVELGEIDPPDLQDNLRAIASREAKLIELQRKLGQSGIKLSLFLRSPEGIPMLPEADRLGIFPNPVLISEEELEGDIASALSQRPELEAIDALANRINVDIAEARNDYLPAVDAIISGSQDMGEPTSSKRDKSEFELEAGVFFDMPVQRRKAIGKSQAARAKLIQLAAKRRFTEDKIRAEIQAAYVTLQAAYQKLERAQEARRLALYMVEVEQRKFRLGDSDLLSTVLREQIAIEAAQSEVDARLEYFVARAEYDFAMARDWPSVVDEGM